MSEQLLQTLEMASEPAIVVNAPAGWGKTTLLARWEDHSADAPFAWLHADRGDTVGTYFHHLVATIANIAPDVGGEARDLLASGAREFDLDVLLTMLVNDLANSTRRVTLVIDDYHLIADSDIDAGMDFLLRRLPAQLRLVVASRHLPDWLGLITALGRGGVLAIGADDLRLDESQQAAVLDRLGVQLDGEAQHQLHQVIEGWPAGLHLASVRLRSSPAGSVIDALVEGGPVREYLAADVLSNLPHELHDYLVDTSIVTRLSPELCEAITLRDDCRELLEQAQQSGLPVAADPGDAASLALHPLVRDYLIAVGARRPERMAQAHLRAANWYADAGDPSCAIEHFIDAGALDEAAQMIVDNEEPLWLGNRFEETLAWIDRLGNDVFARNPMLGIVGGLAAFNAGGRSHRIRELTDTAARAAGDMPRDERSLVVAGASVVRALDAAASRGDAGAALRHIEAGYPLLAADQLTKLHPERGFFGLIALRIRYFAGQSDPLDAAAALELDSPASIAAAANIELQAGDAAAARRHAQDAWHRANGRVPPSSEGWAGIYIALAQTDEDEPWKWVTRAQEILAPRRSLLLEVLTTAVAIQVGRAIGNDSEVAELAEDGVQLLAQCADAGMPGEMLRAQMTGVEATPKQLTERELTVLRALRGPLTQREIGRELHLSYNTIKTYATPRLPQARSDVPV